MTSSIESRINLLEERKYDLSRQLPDKWEDWGQTKYRFIADGSSTYAPSPRYTFASMRPR